MRETAFVMAACVLVAAPAPCLGQNARETWQPPGKILDAVGDKPGMRVGEAGAGEAIFPLARRVGPGGGGAAREGHENVKSSWVRSRIGFPRRRTLVIIERNTTVERAHHPSFMTNRQILETMSETSYVLDRTETFLPRDTIYVYKAKK